MTDVHTPEQRSRNMAAIKGKDTKPEMLVRRMLHRQGYRYRLHDRRLPGNPDIVFPSRRKVVLVHGCYWHVHDCRYGMVVPKTNAEFWKEKRTENVSRDRETLRLLTEAGWETLVVWECEIRRPDNLMQRLNDFLTP